MRLITRSLAIVAVAATLGGIAATASAALVAYDDFERAASNNLGTTSVGGFTWAEAVDGPSNDRIQLVNSPINAAQFNSRGSGSDPTAVVNVGLQDVSVSAIMRSNLVASNNYFGGLRYRVPFPSAGFSSDVDVASPPAGYTVEITQASWSGIQPANSVTLRWANNVLVAGAIYAPTFVTDQDYLVRVDANGDNHKVYVNGTLLIDYTETTPGRAVSGAAGIGTYYGNWLFDNFSVNSIPEPASSALLAVAFGMLGISRSGARRRGSI